MQRSVSLQLAEEKLADLNTSIGALIHEGREAGQSWHEIAVAIHVATRPHPRGPIRAPSPATVQRWAEALQLADRKAS